MLVQNKVHPHFWPAHAAHPSILYLASVTINLKSRAADIEFRDRGGNYSGYRQ